jgi:hypothetical protein
MQPIRPLRGRGDTPPLSPFGGQSGVQRAATRARRVHLLTTWAVSGEIGGRSEGNKTGHLHAYLTESMPCAPDCGTRAFSWKCYKPTTALGGNSEKGDTVALTASEEPGARKHPGQLPRKRLLDNCRGRASTNNKRVVRFVRDSGIILRGARQPVVKGSRLQESDCVEK